MLKLININLNINLNINFKLVKRLTASLLIAIYPLGLELAFGEVVPAQNTPESASASNSKNSTNPTNSENLTRPSPSGTPKNKNHQNDTSAPRENSQPVKIILMGIPESMKPKILQELSVFDENQNTQTSDYKNKNKANTPNSPNNHPMTPEAVHKRLQLLYQQSLSEIHEALKPLGYYKAEVTGNLSKENIATYKINLGPPVMITQLDIQIIGEGKDDKAFAQIIKKNGLATANILVHSKYEELKEKLLDKALQKGYFDAKFDQSQIQIQLLDNQALIILHFNTGVRYHFGGVTFDQKSLNPAKSYSFKNTFLEGYVPFSRGEYYQASEFNLLQTQLSDSGYFKNVYLETEQDPEKHIINIKAKTQPLPAYEYIIGPGYGTDTGPRILTGFKARHITEDGQKFSAQAQISSIYKNFTADYTIPGSNPVTDHFDIGVGQNYTDISAYYARDTFFGVEWASTHGHASRAIALKRHFINFTPQNQASASGEYLVPSVIYSYVDETPQGYFKRGFLASATIQGATDFLFSDTSFIQGILNGKFSLPFARENRILLSGQVGATKASNFENLPTTYRFYAGGLDSVLGYSYYSLGPSNARGLIGGRDILTTSLSLERHLFNQVSGLVFFNMGNAFSQFQDMQLQKAAGVGLSYRSLIGPVTLYVSKPVHSDTQNGLSFNFSMGWYL
jgi:translocation and assembly module TamA